MMMENVLNLSEPKEQRVQSQTRLNYAESRLRKTKSILQTSLQTSSVQIKPLFILQSE